MALRALQSLRTRPGNLGDTERWMSMLAGLGLTLLAARRGGPLRRLTMGTAGLSLLTRGATGYCAAKGALQGERSFTDGLREQWHRVRSGLSATPAAAISSMDELYMAELQELHSAESQLLTALEEIEQHVDYPPLKTHLRGYATEIRSRLRDLELLLESAGVDPSEHPDQAMLALTGETRKMVQVCAPAVRDAALVSSLQRLIHYKLAGYGTVAAYAKELGQIEEAARFAAHADRDKAVDAELSELARETLNPQASVDPLSRPSQEARAH